MARGDYSPEIRTSLGSGKPGRVNKSPPKDSPAEIARDTKRGIKQNSPQDIREDAQASRNVQPPPMHMMTGAGGGDQTNPAHAAIAASIAHAILGRK